MPEALPQELNKILRKTLLRCGPFASDRELRAVFIDARIAPWRDDVPDNTPSRGQRVAFLIDALMDQCTADGNNALVLFLRVLADRTSRGDACHAQLAHLADTLNNVFPATDNQQTISDNQQPTSDKYNIHIHGGQVGVIGGNTEISEGINFGGKPEK